MPLHTSIQYGYILSANQEKLVVAFDEDRQFQYNYAKRKDVFDEIVKLMSKFINPIPALEIVLSEGENRRISKADIINSAENFKERMIRSSFKNNEFVKGVIEEFNAVIVDMDIKTKEEE